MRRGLLAAREAHPVRTLSVVAADLLGPTANPQTSVYKMMVLGPARRGRTAWVMGDPDAPRSFTYIPDLSAAMVMAAQRCEALAPGGSAVLMAPSGGPLSQRQMAADAACVAGRRRARVPGSPLGLHRQRSLLTDDAGAGASVLPVAASQRAASGTSHA